MTTPSDMLKLLGLSEKDQQVATDAMKNMMLQDAAQGAITYAGVHALDGMVVKGIDTLVANSTDAQELLYNVSGQTSYSGMRKAMIQTTEDLALKASQELFEREMVQKAVTKGAVFMAKKAMRIVPGVGAAVEGATAAYQYDRAWDEMREEYGEVVSAYMETKGVDVEPGDITALQLKEYAKHNPIVEDEIKDSRARAGRTVTFGALGVAGLAGEVGYGVYSAVVASRAAYEMIDQIDANQKQGISASATEIGDIVNLVFEGEVQRTYAEMNASEQKAFESVAKEYAEKLNKGEMQTYDLVELIGGGHFHARVDELSRSDFEMSLIREGTAVNMEELANKVGVLLSPESPSSPDTVPAVSPNLLAMNNTPRGR
jgi:hypothetical protein